MDVNERLIFRALIYELKCDGHHEAAAKLDEVVNGPPVIPSRSLVKDKYTKCPLCKIRNDHCKCWNTPSR